ncbi:MAG: type I 3-dehydroquinate dehydratase [Verrucomicrobiota bacterium]
MAHLNFSPTGESPRIVGSSGNSAELRALTPQAAAQACDLVEIRLDLLLQENGDVDRSVWAHLTGLPLLFTARRPSEGGAGGLDAASRSELLRCVLDDAAMIDIEVASIAEMADILGEIRQREIPWIASCHDFDKLPDSAWLRAVEKQAESAGATVFKAAAMLHTPADLAHLAEFQLAPHELLVSTMGMGALAPVSRLLCAQAGSVLNYGYLGGTSTAPGQWDSTLLRTAVARLHPIRS